MVGNWYAMLPIKYFVATIDTYILPSNRKDMDYILYCECDEVVNVQELIEDIF